MAASGRSPRGGGFLGMIESDPLDFLLQRDLRNNFVRSLTRQPWVVVFDSFSDDREDGGFFCALVAGDAVGRVLEQASWDLQIGDALPGWTVRYREGENEAEYHRFGGHEGLEPLLFWRTYHGLRDPHLEIGEEFRHYHNAFWDQGSQTLTKFDLDGSEDVIGRVRGSRLEIRILELRQFLAIKQMHLAVFFDVVRFADVDPEAIPPAEREIVVREDLLRFSFHASPCDFGPRKGRAFSRLLGKSLLPPPPLAECGTWPFAQQKTETFPDFMIGMAKDGSPKTYSCDPNGLANYFGANPHAPNYLTPVFFRREVLARYYANPKKYSVEDGYLRCAGMWGLRMDNNASDYVIVFLGDLGEYLPEKERPYWLTFNVVPDGHMSEVNFRRSFLAQFTDPESPDLVFKSFFCRLAKRWAEKFGWDLFRPLAEADAHHFRTLRMPLTDDQAEFDGQVLSLTKMLIDSLNESKLVGAGDSAAADEGGISKLGCFLERHPIPQKADHIEFLRDLQALRSSGVAHRKGSKYGRVSARFRIGKQPLPDVFRAILRQAIACLEALTKLVEEDKPGVMGGAPILHARETNAER